MGGVFGVISGKRLIRSVLTRCEGCGDVRLIIGILSGPDSKNPFSKADMSKAGKMKTAFSEKIPLERVKDIKVGELDTFKLRLILCCLEQVCWRNHQRHPDDGDDADHKCLLQRIRRKDRRAYS